MRRIPFFRSFALAGLMSLGGVAAQAQTTPNQIQVQIAAGQETQALSELSSVLQAHPKSGKAWYLVAEAQDASGNEAAARGALALAQQYAPGLPFAKPSEAAALQAHLAQPTPTAPQARAGISPIFILGGGIFLLVMLARMFFRRRPNYPAGYGPGYGPGSPGGPPGPYPYGQGPGPGYGPGYGGGGIGGSLLTGLAAGAGLAAGERAIDGMFGNRGGGFDPSQNPGGGNVPGWDDGLNNSPGWDNSTPDDNNNDPGGGW